MRLSRVNSIVCASVIDKIVTSWVLSFIITLKPFLQEPLKRNIISTPMVLCHFVPVDPFAFCFAQLDHPHFITIWCLTNLLVFLLLNIIINCAKKVVKVFCVLCRGISNLLHISLNKRNFQWTPAPKGPIDADWKPLIFHQPANSLCVGPCFINPPICLFSRRSNFRMEWYRINW